VFRRRSRADRDDRAEGQPGEATGEDQERVILSALEDLRDTTVREVMTPRVDVVGLAIPVRASDVAKAVRTSGHSVFPVYDEDLDRVIGILYVNDLFRAGWEIDSSNGDNGLEQGVQGAGDGPVNLSPLDISRRIRQPFLVPESRLVLDVLSDMRREHRSFAVVVDEYGGMAGVLTVKDLLSALVGDLRDEFDRGSEPDVVRVDRRRWLVDGGTSLDDIREQLRLELPEGDYVTLGGYLFDAFGHIPVEGEKLKVDGWELRVAEMDRRRVAKVVAQASDDQVAGRTSAEKNEAGGP
jgi:CBS domain containing-hemolysin-like protein